MPASSSIDQLPVREPVLACAALMPEIPQPPEVALLFGGGRRTRTQRGVDRFFRGAIQLALLA